MKKERKRETADFMTLLEERFAQIMATIAQPVSTSTTQQNRNLMTEVHQTTAAKGVTTNCDSEYVYDDENDNDDYDENTDTNDKFSDDETDIRGKWKINWWTPNMNSRRKIHQTTTPNAKNVADNNSSRHLQLEERWKIIWWTPNMNSQRKIHQTTTPNAKNVAARKSSRHFHLERGIRWPLSPQRPPPRPIPYHYFINTANSRRGQKLSELRKRKRVSSSNRVFRWFSNVILTSSRWRKC